MKKKILLSLLFIFALSTFVSFKSFCVSADTLSTNLIFPKSYVELYDMQSPDNIWTNGEEYVFSNHDTIAYFDGEYYHTYNLGDYNISKTQKTGNFILFVSASNVYALDTKTGNIIKTEIETATDIDIYENTLISNPSNTLSFYTISESDNEFKTTPLKTYNLGFTPNAITLIYDDALYFENEGNIYLFNNGSSIVASNVLNVRDGDYLDGILYISTSDGIFSLNATDNTLSRILVCDKINALSHLYSPFGICALGEKLYIADSGLNTITCYNTVIGSFSDFAITKKLSDEHRISELPSDLKCDESLTYILDGDFIKVYDNTNNTTSNIKLDGYFGSKIFAVSGDKVLLSNLNDIKIAKINGDNLEPVLVNTDFSRFLNVTAVDSLDGDFYILNNEIVSSFQKAVIYKLDTKNYTITTLAEIAGRGENMTVDLFGEIYVNVFNGQSYDLHHIDRNLNDEIFVSLNDNILSLFCDYDGNILYLNDKNEIITLKPSGEKLTYLIGLSPNVSPDATALKLDFSWEDDMCYILFSNMVLSVGGEELKVSTPKKIAIPMTFEITLNTTPQFVKVEKGSKLIEINLENTKNSEYFEYKNVLTKNDDSKYIVLFTNLRYVLIANEDICAIVRAEDITETKIQTETVSEYKYFVSRSNVYAIPLIKDYAKIGSIPLNGKVLVKKIYYFNDRVYALCENENQIGFVTTSMLKSGVAGELNPQNFTTLRLKRDCNYYADSNLIECVGSLNKGEYINITKNLDGISEIYIDGKYYFIESDNIEYKSPTAIRNTIVIGLMLIALLSTGGYLVVSYFRNKKLK